MGNLETRHFDTLSAADWRLESGGECEEGFDKSV